MARLDSDRVDLSSLSFMEIQELEQQIGVKEFERKYGDFTSSGLSNDSKTTVKSNLERKETTKQKKLSVEKWEPVEISSKIKPRSGFGKTQQKTAKIRDPRFDDLSGDFDKTEFEKGYAFLKDIDDEDEKNLKKFVKGSNQEDLVEKAKEKLKQIKRVSREQTKEKKVDEKLRCLKKAEMAAVKEGKKPFFLKKSEKKKLELAEKFKALKQSGKLEKYMEKKRKRNAAKLKKALPE